MIFSLFQERELEQGHESGLAELCVADKRQSIMFIYYQGLGGRMTSGLRKGEPQRFMIPKCNLLGKISLPRELNSIVKQTIFQE